MGLSKKLGKYNLYISYAMANKEPNRDDFESGLTQQPKSEKLGDYEIGLERVTGNNKLSITTYFMTYKDQLILT
jgi:iron complex outermembrane receptor protein